MSIWSEKGLFPQSKTQNFHLLVCQRHDFLAQPGVVVIMCFFHCPGSNGTTTCYCRETDNVANTRFLGHFCTPTMLHLRAFVANQVLSPIRAYFGLFCPDFYSDIADFTQIFCRYLPKKLVAKTSGPWHFFKISSLCFFFVLWHYHKQLILKLVLRNVSVCTITKSNSIVIVEE